MIRIEHPSSLTTAIQAKQEKLEKKQDMLEKRSLVNKEIQNPPSLKSEFTIGVPTTKPGACILLKTALTNQKPLDLPHPTSLVQPSFQKLFPP